jgi:hypothetical protein
MCKNCQISTIFVNDFRLFGLGLSPRSCFCYNAIDASGCQHGSEPHQYRVTLSQRPRHLGLFMNDQN